MDVLIYTGLIWVHVIAGSLALATALAAMLTAKGSAGHRAVGKGFVYAMAVIFATALLIQLLRPNLFLTLIAVFSFYLAFTGLLRARNRAGVATPTQWSCAAVMCVFSVVMIGYGAWLFAVGDNMGLVQISFGGIGGAYAIGELLALSKRAYVGSYRIAAHLTRMLGGTIATVTAVAVVNIDLGEQNWIVWLAPTAVMVPLIVYWNIRVRSRAVRA